MPAAPSATFAVVLLALLLTGCGDGAAIDRLSAGPVVKAASAVSGDTLALADGRRLKLAGVEAPSPGEPFGDEARRRLQALASGRELRLSAVREGAPLTAQARLRANRLWLEGALLDAGAVRVRTTVDQRALAASMLAHEARARRAGRGLWALSAYGVRLPDESAPGDHGLMLVEGRVRKSGRWRGTLYLDFAQDWRSAVSVRVPAGSLRDFRGAGLDPEALEGRLIRVRGDFAWTDGAPELRVDHPEQIELLEDARPR